MVHCVLSNHAKCNGAHWPGGDLMEMEHPMSDALNKLAWLLQDWFEKDGNSPNKLEGITVELGGGIGKIDRRKLTALSRGEDAALSYAQMQALDRFLTKEYRQTFASLFEPSALLPSLLANNHVKVFLGSQPRHSSSEPPLRRTDMSRWDVDAMRELLRCINRVRGKVKLDYEDVLCTDSASAEPSTWSAELMGRGTKKSMVSIGSQRANPATELMLASMFGVANAQDPASSRLPFHFVWDEPSKRPSAFSRDVKKIPESVMRQARVKKREKAPWALEVNGEYYLLERFVQKSKAYGVLAAQRRSVGNSGSQVWLVLAGLSGPGTAATARFIEDDELILPRIESGTHSSVLWMAVEADVELIDTPGDNRIIGVPRKLCDPQIWDPPMA